MVFLVLARTPFVRQVFHGVRDIADCIRQAAFLVWNVSDYYYI